MDASYYREGHGHRSKHHKDRDRHRHHHHHRDRHRRDSRESTSQHEESPPYVQEQYVDEKPVQPPPPPVLPPPVNPVKERNFKLIVDPCLVKGAAKKIYRFDGVVASEPSWNVMGVKDPRPMIPRRWTRPETIDLPVPRFKIDKNYVGDPPELEITITNINDNIDKAFLTDLVAKHGDLEDVSIFYHPVTRKHTGIARIVYLEVAHAAQCVAYLHKRSVMGKSLNAFIDPLGKEWFKMIQRITNPEVFKEEPVETKEAVVEDTSKATETIETKVDVKPEEITPTKTANIIVEPPPQVFNVPPPNLRPQPPGGPPPGWPPHHHEWTDNMWNPPPPVAPQWAPPPPFMSPPPVLPPQPPPDDIPSSLDLDTRIELLLKGGINGMAPPFLSLDEPAATEQVTIAKSRSSSVSLEEEEEPLPPGVELSPSYSPTAPLPSICEYSSDKYLPLSTPPSPFLTEEEYLESLLKWRLRHLSLVQQEEKDHQKNIKLIVSDKVSEISSEEDEAVFAKNDDQMSLSSLSSVNDAIEEVAIPPNPYGSYHSEEASYQQYLHPPPPHPHPSDLPPNMWSHFYPGPGHGYPPHLPPSHARHDLYSDHHRFNHFDNVVEEPVVVDALTQTVDLALDRVCELMTSTLERDIMKKMTEVLAFNVFEKWWETEEKKYYDVLKEPDKDGGTVSKDEPEEKKSTTDALLNSIIDSNFDSGFSLGFRAAMPKMPSFRKKHIVPTPSRNDSTTSKQKRNESDDEEMVKLSDSESDYEPETTKRKKRVDSDAASSESSSISSDLSESESEAEVESNASEDENLQAAREEFLSLVLDDKLEEMRSKTPEERLTPLPFDDFSDVDSNASRASSPSGSNDLKRYAMEALAALGLDEFVESVKIKERDKIAPPIKESKPKTPLPKPQKRKPVVRPTPVIAEKPEKIPVVDKPQEDLMEEGEIKVDVVEPTGADEAQPTDIITVEHSYSLPKGSNVPTPEPKPSVASWILDHDYSGKPAPKPARSDNAAVTSTTKERKKKSEKLVSHLLDNYLKKEPRSKKTYAPRDPLKEMMTCYEFLTKGVDQEDIQYFKKALEVLLADEKQSAWLANMHWADHPPTDLCRPTKRASKHQSGCARTQGFYKLDPIEKKKLKHHYGRNKLNESQSAAEAKTWTAAGREARSHQRRLLTAFGADTDSDLLKFNQLKFRKKFLKFGKSEIHDWGLFAKESIAADEMVIEYVGQKVRPFLADYREIKYQKKGIGSSYLFRIDLEHIVDATTYGNLARFINHSCNPNCYAKIITIESEKKIVIYSKRDIKIDEEITYDYKFPLEEEKIMCLCGDAQCKGTLN